jgi:hypothetical protein
MRALVLSEQANTAFLQELIKDAKDQIRNGFILGVAGLLFASFGIFFYATGFLGFNLAFLTLGIAGVAMVTVAFYIMIRSDMRTERWKRELENIALSAPKSPETAHSADDDDEYYDEKYEDWKGPLEEDEE